MNESERQLLEKIKKPARERIQSDKKIVDGKPTGYSRERKRGN